MRVALVLLSLLVGACSLGGHFEEYSVTGVVVDKDRRTTTNYITINDIRIPSTDTDYYLTVRLEDNQLVTKEVTANIYESLTVGEKYTYTEERWVRDEPPVAPVMIDAD